MLLVALLVTTTARRLRPSATLAELATAPSRRRQEAASLPPGISQVVGAGRRLADAGHWARP